MFEKRIKIATWVVIAIFVLLGVRIWHLQIINGDKYRLMSENNRLRIIKTPAPRGIIFDRNNIPLVKNIPVFSVSINPENISLIDRGALAEILAISVDEINDKFDKKDNSSFVPIKLKQGLGFVEVSKIEARKSDFPGLFVETEIGREYIYGKTGGHVIGYLGKITPDQIKNPELKNFPPDALIGQWGIEALYDSSLRGTPGERIIEVDAIGRELRLVQHRQAVKGNDIILSIDINIQHAVEESFGEKAGSLVAVKPSTGEILALESLPSFDPNLFASGVMSADWRALIEDKKKPMLNRALQSQYPPGSTFKIITAIAALEEKVITPEAKVYCSGGISFGKWTFGCWKKGGHGSVNLHKALVESCDVYFYEVGKRLGIDRIHKYATSLGLGQPTGVSLYPIKERSGLIPSTIWKKEKRKQQWYLGETYNASIGQGYVTTTPVQMAVMLASVLNGGNVYTPTFIKDATPNLVRSFKISDATSRLVKEALSGVVNEAGGTARSAHSSITIIGGKTGTAQVVSKGKEAGGRFNDHAWFVAFAPVENPEIAMTVFVEHGGHGGATAAPIAKKAIEAYFKKPKTEQQKQNAKN
ncbi:MAG: penicillin-binding protein 2 [Nitrospirae bacterium]|nr:penicillin-binding protein 2 [Nitrospirota bacterium]